MSCEHLCDHGPAQGGSVLGVATRRWGWQWMSAVLGCLAINPVVVAQTAEVDCESLPEPRVVIVHGDTQSSMLAELGRVLRDAEEPMTLVHFPRSTCSVASDVFEGQPITFTMRYEPSQAEDPDWDGTPLQCTTSGLTIDLGIGATFISSCSESVQSLQPQDVATFRGPVQAYGFVVPEGSLDAAGGGITQEEAFFVFSGQGEAANAVPWTADPVADGTGTPSVYIRRSTTSTLLTSANNVAPDLLPPDRWVGYRLEGQEDRSSVVIAGVANAPTNLREATIGILGVELYDRERDRLDILAYQAEGQHYGYYPDSSPTGRDKRNVRDGHYVPWGYTEYLARVDSAGEPVHPQVARLLQMVSGSEEVRLRSAAGVAEPFDMDALEVIAESGLIPDCAMEVSRTSDGGELARYQPALPCGCFYETIQDPELLEDVEWQAKCVSCNEEKPCAEGTCLRGYCEVQP